MRNKYSITNNIVTIYIKCKGKKLMTQVDLEDFEKIKDFEFNWYGNRDGRYVYVVAHNNNILKEKPSTIKLHQLIMGFPSQDSSLVIDHINRDTLNNTRSNLRIVTTMENARNCGLSTDNTSGTKGVNYDTKQKRWVARISINGKRKNLGSHKDKLQAIKLREEAELKYWS